VVVGWWLVVEEKTMINNAVKLMVFAPEPPLQIVRDYDESGHEFIIIEGVRYDADYFRKFSHPETDVLYSVSRVEDVVCLTTVETREQAVQFFDEVERA
jgi:hypothetical protein